MARPELLLHRTQMHRLLVTEFFYNVMDTVCTNWYLPAALPALILKHSHGASPLPTP